MRSLVEDELDHLVQQGIIEPVQFADWAAPIVPVLKSDKKSVRICGDFKITVNQASKLDRYPIPKIEDLFSKLSGGKTFSKFDMSQAYQQLVLDESSRKFVVINTQRGLFQYNRLPYGVSSAPGIFQRTMETLLQGIQSVVVYTDDILITGATEEEHLQALDEVLHRLERAGLRLNKTKCVLMASSVTYLGHRIDQYGLHPLVDKVRAVQEAPEPHNVTELKSYLGILSYYSKFLPNLSSTLAPLYQLLCVSSRWRWTAKEREAFKASKQLLTSSKVLTHFDPSEELILAGDTSPYGIGAVLSHRFADGSEKPIGYASRTLSPAEKNYSQIEKETLACIFAVKRFHSYIYGHPFTLYTDHKPLVSLLNEKRPFMGRMFLVLIDSHSKWIEVHPMSSTTSSATIQCLRSIFATFGLPEVLVSDNMPNFVSAEFEDFLLKNGVKHTTSAPYHPVSNGFAERAVQTVKKGLKKMKTGSIQDKISWFLFSYRNTPQTTTGVAPADLLKVTITSGFAQA